MVEKPVLNNKRRVTGQREIRPVWTNAQRVNHQNKLIHPHPKRNFVPTAVATKSGQVPVNAAKQSSPRAAASISTVRPVNTTRVNNVTTAAPKAVVSAAEGNKDNAVKSSACWIWRPKGNVIDHFSKDSRSYTPKRFDYGNPQYTLHDQGIFDSGCSRHMTGNKFYLSDYQKIDGGFVVFDRSPKGGKITGKDKIRTEKLDFEDVYFVKELKFNIFSVSQMCVKKNSVLFTETEYLVLSPDFKLLDEGGLTCLFAKATIDESNLWHRRLGHINFKTMNKLVRGNLVRGLPSKLFENDHKCVACQKGKQHKASCKTKLVSSISQPLQMLHIDLFGPTFVKSLNKKMYCLVVTDDFSRFSWVFFLASKDETSGILKTFITGIENQINHRVKIIRCDNGTEFKNTKMNQFCQMKGIKREFSVARTPQQNGVAERKNRTLIEAARTMLADSLLPTTFWAEAINTACYVQNRVLITKPHNKTPYELLIGRPPNLDFMRPFGCLVTILNTLDHLGKFEGKADEGFLVGYSVNKWLFDIDSLTKSINYEPVTAGNQTNGDAGIETNVNAGQAGQEKASDHEYILLPLIPSNLPLSSSTQSSDDKDTDEVPGKGDDDVNKVSRIDNQERTDSSIQDVNTAGPICHLWNIFDGAYDDEDVDAEADLNNLETTMNMDVKSAFLYGTIEEEVYVCQPPGFEDLQFPDKVYKVEKDLYGLHQAPRAWYKTLSTYLLENRFRRGTIDKTLFIKKDNGDILLVQVYVDDIIFGSTKKSLCIEFERLMHKKFQMSSMGELTFFLGLQVMQRDDGIFISQDKYVAAILKKFDFATVKTASTPLEANKALIKDDEAEDVDFVLVQDSPFDLEAFSDSDYAEASLDRKSTIGEYVVAAANCCGQTLLNIFSLYNGEFGILRQTQHGCLSKETNWGEGFQEIVDFLNRSHIRYALIMNPTIYVSLIEKFWQTAIVKTVDNREQEITATVDGKEFTVTEASVRRHI
ncbi:putative ribonuclease H-like domain-containing protein [Tanacetum coccineum]|uniref:Ribonuclease H-like domain-containing protein n=1 Tax=Tanacetum coccineum TaxID=301880 RepID=A0ABQ5IXT7_9ASTR